jgi:AraC-like DNA-binding protein
MAVHDPSEPARSDFETTDVDRAHEWLQATYTDYRPGDATTPRAFHFHGSQLDLGHYALSRLVFPMQARIEIPRLQRFLVVQVVNGSYEYSQRDVRGHAGHNECVLVPRLQDLVVNWDPLDVGVISLPVANVERVAHELFDTAPSGLRFSGGGPVTETAGHHWRGVLHYVNRVVLPNPDASRSALVQAEAGRLLAVAALSTFANNALNSEPPRIPGRVAPAALRRALDFIDANAHVELTVTDVAEAARIGPRALQNAFRRYLDTTPTSYARRVRLDGAHRDLQSADPSRGDTVAAVATQWGFAHPGRFATLYRDVYGNSPSQTLRE